MSELTDFVKSKSEWLKVNAGEKMNVEYTGQYEKTSSKFGDGYNFSFVTPFGTKKLTVTSKSLILKLDSYGVGDKLVIDRTLANQKGQYPTRIYRQGEVAF